MILAITNGKVYDGTTDADVTAGLEKIAAGSNGRTTVDDLRKQLLSLILARDILKCHAGLILFIYLGVGLTESAEHTAAGTHGLGHLLA